jgi:hypothetical protein
LAFCVFWALLELGEEGMPLLFVSVQQRSLLWFTKSNFHRLLLKVVRNVPQDKKTNLSDEGPSDV